MSKGWSTENIPDQSGKIAIVTGANSGIGLVAARELAGKGATVVVACRSVDKGTAAVEQMRDELAPNGVDAQFDIQALDLADLASVRKFADRIKAAYPGGIDLLINNAGVMAPPRHETADGFELQIGTNHLGHFALTGLLLDELKKKPGARIVTLSSNAHKMGKINFEDLQSEKGYKRWSAYGQSKLANLVFALDLQTRIAEAGLDMKSIGAHPGVSKTNLTAAGNDMGSSVFSVISKPFLFLSDTLMAQDAEHGALPTLYAATNPDLAGGEYIGPDGLGELRGSPTIVAPRKVAHNVEVADQLWTASKELTGVDYDFGQAAAAV
ncbi:MAG: SDR family oxidoreductase [Solirubrobacterales bacterium]|nr:SDR family oxidoreductase [Solirubrobacterales bacterium]